MKKRSALTLLLAAVLAVSGCAYEPFARESWITLIDGASGLDNWVSIGKGDWRAEDGAIVANAGTGYLVSRSVYRDFRVRAEFWADHDTNSGIFLRVSNPAEITPTSSYEVNIFDRRPDPSYGTGAIVNFAKVSPMPKAGGKWNTYDVTFNRDTMTVILNGQKTVDGVKDVKFKSGPIGLQYAAGVIKWRKVEIRPL